MDLNEFLDHLNSGEKVQGGSEVHQFMHGVSQAALRITAEINTGYHTPEELRAVLGELDIDPAVTGQMISGAASSPGMKYKHYSPKAEVIMLDGSLEQFCSYAAAHSETGTYALCFSGEETLIPLPCVCYGRKDRPSEQTQRLFAALRELDEAGAKQVLARCPEASGIGLAVYNRLQRAAAFRKIDL